MLLAPRSSRPAWKKETSAVIRSIRWSASEKHFSPSDRLFFLIGSDAFDELETWKRWEDVVKLTEFIVVTRPEHEYHTPKNARVHRLEGLSLPVSSSSIRARLAAGEPTPELPAEVCANISKHTGCMDSARRLLFCRDAVLIESLVSGAWRFDRLAGSRFAGDAERRRACHRETEPWMAKRAGDLEAVREAV